MRKLATTLALSSALVLAGSALAALPISGNFTGTTSAHAMNGFKDLVTFVSAGGGRTLKQFQFGTLGCLGTGLFPVGTDPYAQAYTLGTLPKVTVSTTGTILTTAAKAQFAEADNVVTTVSIKAAFANSKSLSGTITVSQTENGSTCKANPMKFSAVPGTPSSLGYEGP
jgi:hypothetical protein